VFESVGLNPSMLRRFPYEMSGGERQRVGFAQALAVRPKLILADEPVSMLDVSIRAGVLNMMAGLRDREGVSILYITHDLASARYVADRVVVMYAGHQVEAGPTETVLSDPKHPYTQLLLSAVAGTGEQGGLISADTGEPPRVVNPSEGCRFRWRCPHAIEKCSQVTPRPRPIGSVEVACHVAVGDGEDAGNPGGAASITHGRT
jgi:peptide/nickel transport system ATP-binding protein